MKKIKAKKLTFIILITVFSIISFFSLNNQVLATEVTKQEAASVDGVIDSKTTNNVYKYSEESSLLNIPFMRGSTDRVLIDKEISGIGVTSSGKSIDVTSTTGGIQTLFAADSVRVNAKMEYTFIYATNNVVIDSEITRTVVIMGASEVNITENAKINENLIIFQCSNVNIKGEVAGNVIGIANSLNINGNVSGDCRVRTNYFNVDNKDRIKGNIFIETYNNEILLKDMYPNAQVNLLKAQNVKLSSIIFKAITTSLIFALVYVIIKAINKGEVFKNMLERTAKHKYFTILSATIMLLLSPTIIIILIMLSMFGLYIVAIPILLIYIALIISIAMTCVLIVGGIMFEYINSKYIKSENIWTEAIGVFFTFFSLNALIKIPKVGTYIYMFLILLAVGIVSTSIFKRADTKVKNNK